MATYDSPVDISLGHVPNDIQDEAVYRELLDLHNAIEALVTYASDRTRFRGAYIVDEVYFKGDQVINAGLLLWANKKTVEAAIPSSDDWEQQATF